MAKEFVDISRYLRHNLSYTDELPRAHRWLPMHESDSLQSIREQLDDLAMNQVIWTPYERSRAYHPLHEITFFSGYLKVGSVIEPYHPERVLRQLGHVQSIPSPPLSPIDARQGATIATYQTIYHGLSAFHIVLYKTLHVGQGLTEVIRTPRLMRAFQWHYMLLIRLCLEVLM